MLSPRSALLKIPYPGHGDVWSDSDYSVRLFAHGLRIDFKDDDDYPWILTTGPTPGWLIELHRHRLQDEVALGLRTALELAEGEEEVIHHRNGNVLDARIENLEAMPRGAHSKLHLHRRQKHSYRKRFQNSLYSPRPPGPVVRRTELIGWMEHRPRDSSPTPSSQEHLQAAFRFWVPWVREQVGHRDSGLRMPPQLRDKKVKSEAKIRLPRMAPTDAEAALLGFLVLHRQNTAAVCKVVATAAGLDAQEVSAIIKGWLGKPALAEARIRWQKYSHLPKQISHRWLRAREAFPANSTWLQRGDANRPGAWNHLGAWLRRVDEPLVQRLWSTDQPLPHGDYALLLDLGIKAGSRRFNLAVACNSSHEPTELFHDNRHWRFLRQADRSTEDPRALIDWYPSAWCTEDGSTMSIKSIKTGRNGRLAIAVCRQAITFNRLP